MANDKVPFVTPARECNRFARTFYISSAKITRRLQRKLPLAPSDRYNIHIYQPFSGSTFGHDLASDL